MPQTVDEQTLLADFRCLTPEGKAELLQRARLLAGKSSAAGETSTAHCTLERKEPRPETTPEPIFTE